MLTNDPVQAELEVLRKQGLERSLEIEKGLSFIHNDYLGLSSHSALKEAAKEAIDCAGVGSRGSRLLGGHSRFFEETEVAIADFFGAPEALFFSTGYLANMAAVTSLAKLSSSIVSDEKNHASLIDGIRLSALPKQVLPHGCWAQLSLQRPGAPLLISESLFSMDGDVAPLMALLEAQRRWEGYLLLDEAHAAGVFGLQGRGYAEGIPLDWDRTVVNVTFGKAFGASGAALLLSASMKRWVLSQARTFIYTTAPPPAVLGAVSASLKIVRDESWRREELWDRSITVRDILQKAGVPVWNPPEDLAEPRSPIVPVLIPGNAACLRICQNMRDLGLETRAIRYPTVAKGSERIRLSINLTASRDNTIEMAHQLANLWQASSLQEPTPESERPPSPPAS